MQTFYLLKLGSDTLLLISFVSSILQKPPSAVFFCNAAILRSCCLCYSGFIYMRDFLYTFLFCLSAYAAGILFFAFLRATWGFAFLPFVPYVLPCRCNCLTIFNLCITIFAIYIPSVAFCTFRCLLLISYLCILMACGFYLFKLCFSFLVLLLVTFCCFSIRANRCMDR